MTATTVKSLIALLQSKYPNPVSLNDHIEGRLQGHYCVAGAWFDHIGERSIDSRAGSFPTAERVERVLMQHNPNLTYPLAFYHAQRIVEYNEKGKFEQSWEHLEAALDYGGEK